MPDGDVVQRDVDVLEIVEAAEGSLRTERCAFRDGPCRWDAACAIHPTWVAVADAVREKLAATSLADLAAEDGRLMQTEPARSARSGR